MCGFDDTAAQNIVLAVDEACQNIIVHGYKGREDGEILLSLARKHDGIQVCLVDSAPLRRSCQSTLGISERLEVLLSELDSEGWEVRDDLTVLVIDDSKGALT